MGNPIDRYHIYPLGDSAITVEFGKVISPEAHHQVYNFMKLVEGSDLLPGVECVPSFTALTIYYDPQDFSVTDTNPYSEIERIVKNLLNDLSLSQKPDFKVVEVPVQYGGATGPDLEKISKLHNMTPEQLIGLHSAPLYTVYMIGFLPGFPYLGGLDARLITPRLETPRNQIVAGSVGIGGSQTGIYPIDSPGGWQIIGKTSLKLFDPSLEVPVLLNMGDKLKFIPVEKL